MLRKALILNTLFIILIFPTFLLGQIVGTSFSADRVIVKPDNTIFADGNVVIRQGAIFIRAKSVTINQESSEIHFSEIMEFSDNNAVKISAEEAVLDTKISSGIISAARIVIDETIKIQASQVTLKNGKVATAKDISRITSCDDCETGSPLWYFTASSANRDMENSNIVYRNVTLRVKAIPIAYFPYLRLPDPNVSRARGFLNPEVAITSNLGAGVKLPYFIPIGRSRDLLITPFISPNTKTLEYRYREKFRKGDFTANGAISYDDLMQGGYRYFYKLSGRFKLKYGLNITMQSGFSKDDLYLRDYSYGSAATLKSRVAVSKTVANRDRFFKGNLNYVGDDSNESSLREYYSARGTYIKHIEQNFLTGNLALALDVNSSYNVIEKDQLSRPPSSLQLGMDYSDKKYLGPLVLSNKSFIKFNSFINSEDSETFKEEFTSLYGVSSELLFPIFKRQIKSSHFVYPKIMVAFNQQDGRVSGNSFRSQEELSFGNIYAGKKYSSLSESETGISLSMGVGYQTNWGKNDSFELSIGGLRLGGATYQPVDLNGLNQDQYNYLGSFKYKNKAGYSLYGEGLLTGSGNFLRGTVKADFSKRNLKISGGYDFYASEVDSRLSNDLMNLEYLSSYNFSQNLNVTASGRYDLYEQAFSNSSYTLNFQVRSWQYSLTQDFLKQEQEKISLSTIYNDDCTRIKISLENQFASSGTSNAIQSLKILAQLKPFGSFPISDF